MHSEQTFAPNKAKKKRKSLKRKETIESVDNNVLGEFSPTGQQFTEVSRD